MELFCKKYTVNNAIKIIIAVLTFSILYFSENFLIDIPSKNAIIIIKAIFTHSSVVIS